MFVLPKIKEIFYSLTFLCIVLISRKIPVIRIYRLNFAQCAPSSAITRHILIKSPFLNVSGARGPCYFSSTKFQFYHVYHGTVVKTLYLFIFKKNFSEMNITRNSILLNLLDKKYGIWHFSKAASHYLYWHILGATQVTLDAIFRPTIHKIS